MLLSLVASIRFFGSFLFRLLSFYGRVSIVIVRVRGKWGYGVRIMGLALGLGLGLITFTSIEV